MTEQGYMNTSTIDGHMRDEELLARLPEVELIEDDELRRLTKDALARGVPDYFWRAPATASGYYHNTFSKGDRGLWIHVKMAFSAYERVVRSWVEQGLITSYEADCGRAALLCHDMLKFGHEYSDGSSTQKNHDLLAGMWLKNNTELPGEVIQAVESHNGSWYEGPVPDSNLDQLVHVADMVASTKNITCGVWKPHEDIMELYPDLPQAYHQ